MRLQGSGNETHVLIKGKDVLIDLLNDSGIAYKNILPDGKGYGKLGLFNDLLKRGSRMITYCKKHNPDLLIGTSADISYVGKLLDIPAINVNEDDAAVIPFYAWISYPWATAILSPDSCNNGRWNNKTINYKGYHELAYLHPDHFLPDKSIVFKYVHLYSSYIILRFSSLNAHHDKGIRGISCQLAKDLIHRIEPYGKIIITSEYNLDAELESYRMPIDPVDMHHLLAHAKLVIGDSQTMTAEAGVLGTPFIRYNDFVGKIGYLMELEERYELGYGIKPDFPELIISKAEEIITNKESAEIFQQRREKMLSEKINVVDFIYEYIINILGKTQIKGTSFNV